MPSGSRIGAFPIEHGIVVPMEATGTLGKRSPADEKIAWFRSLFRGRSEVYARRFVSRKTGKAGYAPACG